MEYPTELLRELLPELELTDEQLEQFNTYACLLAQWNEKINLTSITEPKEVVIKHFVDSIIALRYVKIPKGASVIDVGTGAGFPGIPFKIARPDIKLTLLDSLNKRLIFLNEVCQSLNFEAKIIHSRAEEGARTKQMREKYDFATARAVAHLRELSEYCLPYVKPGGAFIALKGSNIEQEKDESAKAISILGGKVKNIYTFDLSDYGGRNIIEIGKINSTPTAYPRQSAKIKSKPLN